eukprot:3141847-Ditylum_brightwellii.AAC.1
METYAQYAPSNFQHRYLLLQAESAFLSGDDKNASTYYDAAIKTAAKAMFHWRPIVMAKHMPLFSDGGLVAKLII